MDPSGRSRVELRDIKAFVQVAEASGFRRASAQQDVRQSVLSRRVRDLEEELGVSLLERHRSGARLTIAGREFLTTARSALAELEYGARRAASAGKGASGHLRIGVFASIASGFSYDAIAAFRSRHTDVAIEIAEDAPADHLLRIQERRLDLAIVTGVTRVGGLSSERVWTEKVALAMPRSHMPLDEAAIGWERLQDERFIVSCDEPGPEIQDWLTPRLAALGRHPDIVRCKVARETLLTLVGLGFGLTVVSESATGVSYRNVEFRYFEREEDLLPLHVVWSDENDNPALRRFLSLVRAMANGRTPPEPP